MIHFHIFLKLASLLSAHECMYRFTEWSSVQRAIPSVVDGLKPSQRKILHTLLQRKERKEVKVNQLAAEVSLKQAYHHGEVSYLTDHAYHYSR